MLAAGRFLLVFQLLLASVCTFSQCLVEKGPPPESFRFKTGGSSPGSQDTKWMVAVDSINGEYKPAVIMDSLASIYYSSSDWISIANPGEHTGDRLFFFRAGIELPCRNLCDVSYSEPNTFCLSFDIYVDNSILEVYVNGKPQSDRLDKIPMADPFRPDNHSPNTPIPVRLCQDWQPGRNELIIVVASSAPILGLMIMESQTPAFPPGTDTTFAEICGNETYLFNNQQLRDPGLYWYTYTNASGCDSVRVLDLKVNPVPTTVINATICEGEAFEGRMQSGSYTDIFSSVNGCDSVRILNLTVKSTPDPVLGPASGICAGDSIVLYPGEYASYLWQDGSTGSKFTVKQPGTYSVQVSNGCYSATGQIVIADGVCQIRFPNAFSPNADGRNETFMMKSDLRVEEYRLAIYNRWGQKVFETRDPGDGWTGETNGRNQPAGVYAWICTFRKNGSAASKSGTVVLYR